MKIFYHPLPSLKIFYQPLIWIKGNYRKLKKIKKGSRLRPATYVALSLIILFTPLAYFLTKNPGAAKAAWFNDNWLYRKPITITNSGSAQTDFQVQVTVDTAALITEGKMQSDCDDIRITDINGKLLPHWIETGAKACNTSTTYIWTKAPFLPTSGATIYLYYGNPSASNTQKGNETFEFFDDFSSNTLGVKWTGDTSDFSISGGLLNGATNNDKRIQSNTSFTGDYEVIARTYTTTSATNGFEIAGFWASTSNSHGILNHNGIWYTRNDSSWVSQGAFTFTQWVRATNKVVGTAGSATLTGETSGTDTASNTNSGLSSEYVALGRRYDNASYAQSYNNDWDWIFVRKAASTEPSAGSPGNEEQSPGPAAYWKFDEGYGTNTYDSTTNANNGTISGATWQSEDMCVSGKCLYFDGSDDLVTVGTTGFGSTKGTVSLWVKPTNSIPSQSMMFAHQSGNNRLYIGINSSPAINIGIADNGGINVSQNLVLNEWQHLSFTYDSGAWYFYYNGKQISTGSYSGLITFASAAEIADDGGSSWTTNFPGFIDEAKVYPYARTAAQIKSDYLHHAGAHGSSAILGASKDQGDFLSEGLVGYWKMDEASANTCSGGVNDSCDSSGNGRDAAWNGSATTVAGKFANGATSDAASSSITVSSPYIDIGSSWAIATWFQTPLSTIDASWRTLTRGNGGDHQVIVRASDGHLGSYDNSGGGFNDSGYVITNLSNGWHHLAAIAENGTTTFYIDGASVGSVNFVSTTDIRSICSYWGNSQQWGKCDDFRIYNRAFSPKEVRDLYNWAPGPIAYWKLDEHTGTNAYDSSGNGFNGSMEASMTEEDWVPGKFGSALDFDGTDDYVEISDNDIFSFGNGSTDTPFSLSVWVNWNSGVSIINKWGAGNAEWRLRLSSGQLQFHLYDESEGTFIGRQYGSSISTGIWYHVATTYDGSSSASGIKIYLNGKRVDDTDSSGGGGTYAAMENLAQSVRIGLCGGDPYINAKIDEVKIYNHARTPGQIIEDMNAGHPVGGSPVGSALLHLKLDEGYGTTAYDTGYNDDDGVLTDGPSWTNSGKFDKGLSLDGTNDRIQSFTSNPFEYTGDDLTLSIWFKPNASDIDIGRIISKPWNGSGQYNYQFYLNANETLTLSLQGATSWSTTTTDTITNGEWQHLTVSINGATDQVNIYINGRLSKSDTYNITDWTPGSGDNNVSLVVGCLYPYGGGWGGNTGHCVQGEIDELKIYTTALTEDEIKLDYNQGKALVLGSMSTDSSGNADWSSERSYCPPGDTTVSCSPVAEWKLDEKTGSSAYDTTGNGNNGSFQGSPTWQSAEKCKQGACISGDGNDYVTVPDTTDHEPSNITVESWVYWSSIGDQWIISKQTSTYSDYNYGYLMRSDSPSDTVFCNFGYGSSYVTTGGASITAGQWYHVACTYDGTTGRVYLNGKLANSSGGGSALDYTNVGNLGIMAHSGGSLPLNGRIDHVKIYDYARSQAQIAWDYNRGGPVGWWKFDEGEGITAHDASGNGNNGVLTNMEAADWVEGKFNKGLNFDGVGGSGTGQEVVVVTDADEIDMDVSRPFTLSFWIKPDGTEVAAIIRKGGQIEIYKSGSKFYYRLWNPTQTQWSTTYSFTTGQWVHIVATHDGNSAAKLYVNGNLDINQSYSGSPSSTTNNLGIGAYPETSYGINGIMDDVRIFNYALTAEQIKLDYNNGAAVRFN